MTYKVGILFRLILGLSSLLSSASGQQPSSLGGTNTDERQISKGCFPEGAFDQVSRARNDFIAEGMEKLLNVVREPCLFPLRANLDAQSFRFIRIAPGLKKLILRLEIRRDQTATIYTVVLSSGGEPFLIEQRSVTAPDVQAFLQLVKTSQFWSMPATERANKYKDGQFWVVEGASSEEYHIVTRENPAPSVYTELVRFFATRLANLDNSVFSFAEYRIDSNHVETPKAPE